MATTFLRSGVNWLRDRIDEAAAETVTYSQGSRTWSIKAVPLTAEGQIIDIQGIGTAYVEIDWVLFTDQLETHDILPRTGDRITLGAAIWELEPLANQKCIVPHDQFSTMQRAHTRRVKK